MGYFYFDETIQERGGFIIGAFVYAPEDKTPDEVDFIIRKDLEYRKVEFNRRRKMEFEGGNIFVVSPEDLLISKLFWARESMSGLQIGDVRNLLETVGELDREYIEKWVRKLELDDVWKAALG